MSTTIKNIKIPYATEGVIRSAQLNDTIAPENSVQLGMNLNFDQIGAVTTRLGLSQLATIRGGSIISLGTLNILGGVKYLYSQVGTDISVWNGAIWSSVRTTTATIRARYGQFLNRVWMVNGTSGDNPMTSNGGIFDTTDIPTGFPKADFIQCGFDGRIWTASASLDAVYYTDQIQFSGSAYTVPTPWNTLNFIEWLSPQDGESITGLFRVPRALLVFKQNHIYRIFNSASADPFPAYNVGTYSQESVIQAKDGVYFHHSSGFYKFNYDAQPTEISRRVIDFVKAIPRSSYENIQGIYNGFDAIEWAVGPVTVEGVTYTNCVMRYTLSTQIWTTYDYPNNIITALVRYDNGTTIDMAMGTSTGRVNKMDSGNLDLTAPINYELIDRWRSFTEMYMKSKALSGMMISSLNAGGANVEYQIQKQQPNNWEFIGTMDENQNTLFPNMNTSDFNTFRYRITGSSSGVPIIFTGVEILSLQDKGFEEN